MRGNEGSHPNCETLSGEGVRRERDTVWIPTHLPLFISYLRGSLFIGGLYFFTDTMELHNAVKSSKKTRMKKKETRKKKKKMKKINKNKEIDLLIVFANFFQTHRKFYFFPFWNTKKKKLSNSFTSSNAYSPNIYFFFVWNTKKTIVNYVIYDCKTANVFKQSQIFPNAPQKISFFLLLSQTRKTPLITIDKTTNICKHFQTFSNAQPWKISFFLLSQTQKTPLVTIDKTTNIRKQSQTFPNAQLRKISFFPLLF